LSQFSTVDRRDTHRLYALRGAISVARNDPEEQEHVILLPGEGAPKD